MGLSPVAAPRADVAAIVVGGGGGERLGGGVSKPDLTLGGVRLIDRVCGALLEACGAGCVAVVPPAVRVPDGVRRTLEDPPNGGPLAGIDAGLRALSVGDDVLVVIDSVDEAVASLGSVRGVGVRRVLRALEVERVSVSADVCRDIDTPADVAWWEALLGR